MNQKKIIRQNIKMTVSELNLLSKQLRQEKANYKKVLLESKKNKQENKEKSKLIKSLEKELHLYKNDNQYYEENIINDIQKKIIDLKNTNENFNSIDLKNIEDNILKIQEKIVEITIKKFSYEKQLFEEI